MSNLVAINLKPDTRTLRQFGWIALAGFGLLALIAWNEWLVFSMGLGVARSWVAGAFAALAVTAAIFSLVAPNANLPIYLGLTIVAYPIGFVLSYLIMGTLFYGLFTPLGLLFKLTGRDAMNRRFETSASSYWVKPRSSRSAESYFKQF